MRAASELLRGTLLSVAMMLVGMHSLVGAAGTPVVRDARVARSAYAAPAPKPVQLKPPATQRSAEFNHVFMASGTLQRGARKSESFVLPKLDHIGCTLLGKGVVWSFRSPSGTIIVPGKTERRAGYQYSGDGEGVSGFMLNNPEEGRWTVVSASLAESTVAYAIDVRAEGPAEESAHLEVMLRDSDPTEEVIARPGERVFVRVYVTNGDKPMPGIRWDVRVLTPLDSSVAVPVFDDGKHSDGQAGDGVFVGHILAEAQGDGLYRLFADGRTARGVHYSVINSFEVQIKSDLLIVDAIDVSPKLPKVGQTVTLTITAKNDGALEYRNAKLELYVDKIKMEEQRVSLRPGESRRMTTTWLAQQPVEYLVQLILSSYDEPSSSDFANNTRQARVRVQ